jgi:sec-independent protein translocase protein TatB
MFDISWTEFLLIGVVALIVIGPKELPAVMRTMGQWTRKVRSMAADFQNQFQEAMREAEMADLKKQVDDMTHFDPLKDVKSSIDEVKSSFDTMGKDLQASVEAKPAETSGASPAVATGLAATVAPPAEAPGAAEAPPAPAAEPATASETAGAALPEAVPETAHEAAAAESTGRSG